MMTKMMVMVGIMMMTTNDTTSELSNSLFSKVVALLIFPLETWLRDGTR